MSAVWALVDWWQGLGRVQFLLVLLAFVILSRVLGEIVVEGIGYVVRHVHVRWGE